MLRICIACLLLSCVCISPSYASDENNNNSDKKTGEGTKTQDSKKDEKKLEWFGLGPAITINSWHKDRVDEASVDGNGIIRLDEQSDSSVGVFLEVHRLWEPRKCIQKYKEIIVDEKDKTKYREEVRTKKLTGCVTGQKYKDGWLMPGLSWPQCPQDIICGRGFFIGAQPGGSNDIIDALGAGLMWGFKGDDHNLFGNQQVNFGVGVIVDPNVKTLGDGLFENQPLPAGDSLRFKEDYQTNLMIMFSWSPSL